MGTYDGLIMRPGFVYVCVCICFSHGSVFKRVWGRMVRPGPFIHPSTHSCRSLLPCCRMGWRLFLDGHRGDGDAVCCGVDCESAGRQMMVGAGRHRTQSVLPLCTLLPKRAGAL